jgi:plasmid stabilization system protein ParE
MRRRKCAALIALSLAAFPRIGVHRSGRDLYEVVILRTPFIAFYRTDAAADTLTVVALFTTRKIENPSGERMADAHDAMWRRRLIPPFL